MPDFWILSSPPPFEELIDKVAVSLDKTEGVLVEKSGSCFRQYANAETAALAEEYIQSLQSRIQDETKAEFDRSTRSPATLINEKGRMAIPLNHVGSIIPILRKGDTSSKIKIGITTSRYKKILDMSPNTTVVFSDAINFHIPGRVPFTLILHPKRCEAEELELPAT